MSFVAHDASARSSERGKAVSAHVALIRPPMRLPQGSYTTLACPPLGLAYLAAALRANGIAVTIVDAVGEAPRRLSKARDGRFLRLGLDHSEVVSRIPADVTMVGVTCMFSESWPMARRTVQAIRAAFPHTRIVLGGEHPTALPELSLRDCVAADAVALGEGEQTIVDLARTTAAGSPLRDVPGIVFRDGEACVRTMPRRRIRAVDDVPWPAWDLVPLESYLSHGLGFGIGRRRSVPILATRGCPFQCTFCSSPAMWTTRWATRDPSDVLDEMQWAVREYGAENFDFYDLTAILRKDWIVEFCQGMLRRGLRITWQIPSGTRSEALDAEVLDLLRRTGVGHVVYAPESGSESVLRRVKKRVDLPKMKDSIATASRTGLTVKCNLIVGFPGETWSEAMETVDLCRQLAHLGATDVNIGPFSPYPGSVLYEQLVADGRLRQPDDDYFDMLTMYSDLSRTRSWSEHIADRELTLLRWMGMTAFYARSFGLRPARFFRLPRNVITGQHETRLDRALGDIFRRLGDSLGAPRA